MKISCFSKAAKQLFVLIAIFCSSNVSGVEIPQAGTNPIVIDQLKTTDNVTYLMAAAAARPDTTSVQSYGQPKHAWLQSVDNTEYLDWTIQTGNGENFHVTTLVSASAGESFKLEILGTSNSLSYTLTSAGWQRHDSGTIYIPAGTNTLRFTRTSNNGDIHIKSLELIAQADMQDYLNRVTAFKSDTSKLSNARYGLMFQYGAWGYPQSGSAKSIDDQAADFNVPAFVQQVKNMGAEYVIWSATWWTYEFNAPISAVDSLLGHSNRTSGRDLINDIATALDAEGIDFYLYYHTGQDSHLGYNSTDWWQLQNWPSEFRATGAGDRTTFFNNWKTVISAIGNRYGNLLDGWFFDDGLVYYPAPFESLGAAAKAGNPDRLISYNPWIVAHYTDFEDVSFGEHCKSSGAPVGGSGLYTSTGDSGLYGHCMWRMENDWGIRSANQSIGSPNYTVASATAKVQSDSSRKVPTSFNLMMYEDGTMSQASVDVLVGMKTALDDACVDNCIAINNSEPEITYNGNWRLSSNRGVGDYQDDVQYTRQNGDYFEYSFTGSGIRVYMPVYNAGGDIEVFIDGVSQGTVNVYAPEVGSNSNSQMKVFEKSDLSAGPHTIKLVKLNGPYMQLDKLEVIGNFKVLNNTDPDIGYNGNWSLSSNRGVGDYQDDVHYTQQNGDYFQYVFTGTRISVYMPVYNAGGDIEVFIDDVSQGIFSAYASETGSSANSQQKVYETGGLAAGRHTIKLVKLNGSYMQFDKLVVTTPRCMSTKLPRSLVKRPWICTPQ
ncbi:alpha-L-fucosidase [Microbulbifer sp. TYP-18]|uniref:alpha-L-fucosidase n=1 Tax=Microbulbifer sp. TYP-18 TaxID=3230024 RepID=UPI0034C6096D